MIDTSELSKLTAPMLKAQQQAFSSTKYCLTEGCESSTYSWCHLIPESAQLKGIADTRPDGGSDVAWFPMRERERWRMTTWW